ncbi:hypothetical protein BC939DRAFT_507421 [Gamsiella multidivaricata]|uniref:uncharacterized protein n=1 Tax=Gamsiella multidivaricata TaxID=101098 RepID=UPI00222112F4|nr:uncharacterized protein BC939DRAFT_507421 [Gamsiella multidivaricata]KAI7817384.1 hypothetical protein BC939DRAFT_507421 [Gamsiella multidivaricata]
MLKGDEFYDRSPDLTWSISDLCRGITPVSLIKEWGSSGRGGQAPGTGLLPAAGADSDGATRWMQVFEDSGYWLRDDLRAQQANNKGP